MVSYPRNSGSARCNRISLVETASMVRNPVRTKWKKTSSRQVVQSLLFLRNRPVIVLSSPTQQRGLSARFDTEETVCGPAVQCKPNRRQHASRWRKRTSEPMPGIATSEIPTESLSYPAPRVHLLPSDRLDHKLNVALMT